MREILFRGKRIDNGEWVEGWLTHRYRYDKQSQKEILGPVIDYRHKLTLGKTSGTTICSAKVDPTTVGQYTGLTDKNGQWIFEGDVCRFREWENGDMCWIGAVCFERQQFVIIGGPNKECETSFHLQMSRFVPRNIERIGTVHDNPELLEGGSCNE